VKIHRRFAIPGVYCVSYACWGCGRPTLVKGYVEMHVWGNKDFGHFGRQK
jgi:hypothetical protein